MECLTVRRSGVERQWALRRSSTRAGYLSRIYDLELGAGVGAVPTETLASPASRRAPMSQTNLGSSAMIGLDLAGTNRGERATCLHPVSSHSACGSLRQVIPPPTWRVRRSPSAT